MKSFIQKAAIIILCSVVGLSAALAASIEEQINNLKNENADVRAKAAYELGCG